jgi:hypothetical protein
LISKNRSHVEPTVYAIPSCVVSLSQASVTVTSASQPSGNAAHADPDAVGELMVVPGYGVLDSLPEGGPDPSVEWDGCRRIKVSRLRTAVDNEWASCPSGPSSALAIQARQLLQRESARLGAHVS